jgi:hypothetical protein
LLAKKKPDSSLVQDRRIRSNQLILALQQGLCYLFF